jgi:hypothetical protein
MRHHIGHYCSVTLGTYAVELPFIGTAFQDKTGTAPSLGVPLSLPNLTDAHVVSRLGGNARLGALLLAMRLSAVTALSIHRARVGTCSTNRVANLVVTLVAIDANLGQGDKKYIYIIKLSTNKQNFVALSPRVNYTD